MPTDALLLSLLDDRYRALWRQSPQRSPFSHPDAVRAYAEAFGFEARILGVPDESGGLDAAVPMFEKRRGPFVASALPPLCPVHQPLLAATPTESAVHGRDTPLDALLGALGHRYDKSTLQLSYALADVRPLRWAGWTVEPRSTYTLDLAGDTEARFSSNVRRTIRRDSGQFEIVEDAAHTPALVRLVGDAYRRSETDLGIEARTTEDLIGAFGRAGLARVVSAVRDGEPEASVAVARDGETAFYWIAGSVPGPAMTVLLGALLPQLAADGVRRFDFCGANTPAIAEFKRRFGPTLTPAPRASVAASRVLRIAEALRA